MSTNAERDAADILLLKVARHLHENYCQAVGLPISGWHEIHIVQQLRYRSEAATLIHMIKKESV